jgi:hypothetical protein
MMHMKLSISKTTHATHIAISKQGFSALLFPVGTSPIGEPSCIPFRVIFFGVKWASALQRTKESIKLAACPFVQFILCVVRDLSTVVAWDIFTLFVRRVLLVPGNLPASSATKVPPTIFNIILSLARFSPSFFTAIRTNALDLLSTKKVSACLVAKHILFEFTRTPVNILPATGTRTLNFLGTKTLMAFRATKYILVLLELRRTALKFFAAIIASAFYFNALHFDLYKKGGPFGLVALLSRQNPFKSAGAIK